MIGQLPQELEVNGRVWPIRSDYRDVLNIIEAFNDPDLEGREQAYICLYILYPDFEDIPEDDYEAAFKAAIDFIDQGMESSPGRKPHHVMDWQQDEHIMFPAINKAAGFEVRAAEYIHWWTFLGYYMEISEGIFATVLDLRLKKAKGKKLEKHEQAWWRDNKDLCVLKPRYSAEEKAERDRINALLS